MKQDPGGAVAVIGGGCNGLACAAALARAGRAVVLLEARDVLGGLSAREEFAPGFWSAGVHHETGLFRSWVAQQLELDRFGLRWSEDEPELLVADPEDGSLRLRPAGAVAAPALAAASRADAGAWEEWQARCSRLRRFLGRVLDEPAPDTDPHGLPELWQLLRTGIGLRRLGARDASELLRILPMSAADWLNEWFELPLLKGALAALALSGTWMGPWSPGSAALLLFDQCSRGRSVAGGPAAVVEALAASARAAGAELRTGAPVASLRVDGGAVRGVLLASGEALDADAVVATCDPRRALQGLVPRRALPPILEERMRTWRMRGTTAVVRVALDGPLVFAGQPAGSVARGLIAGDLVTLERAFDGVKYGRLPERPCLDVAVTSAGDDSRAPRGSSALTILVHFVPYALEGGWTSRARSLLAARVLGRLDECAPGMRARVASQQVLAPPDLEATYGLCGGQIHHGEPALDQLLHLRPAPECSRSATPLPGLFLGGSGCHPGGGVTGVPGMLAARAVLEAGARR